MVNFKLEIGYLGIDNIDFLVDHKWSMEMADDEDLENGQRRKAQEEQGRIHGTRCA